MKILYVGSERNDAQAVAKALRVSGLGAAYKPAGVTGRQLAETLNASARGLKHGAATRDAFLESMAIAVRVMCLPLRQAGEKTPASQRSERGGSRPRRPHRKTR